MIEVVQTLSSDLDGGAGRRVRGSFVVFQSFVDIKDGLAGGGVGFV